MSILDRLPTKQELEEQIAANHREIALLEELLNCVETRESQRRYLDQYTTIGGRRVECQASK